MTKLTTIVPVYDGEYIDECLNSMLSTFDSNPELSKVFDIVIVSDGSDDNTLKKLTYYESKYNNVKLIKSVHVGASHARNLGLMAAEGEYLTFLDCDDRMCENFFSDCFKYFEKNADLYIFGIKRFEDNNILYWKVNDKEYNSNGAFADDYIVNRHLLIYSNTNKFYKTSIIKANNLKFDENIEFGEDRLFNFLYLRYCKNIITSSIYKIDYVKRKDASMSTKYQKNYFEVVLKLHREKMKCFLDLSRNATETEKKEFVAYDIGQEFERAIARFDNNKEEVKETVPLMNEFIFDDEDPIKDNLGVLFVLGSNNCGYRIEKALEIGKNIPYIKYVVSGGNIYKSGDITEAEFMAKFLLQNGISRESIFIDNSSKNTIENLLHSKKIIDSIINENNKHNGIGIITAGFHIKRAKIVSKQAFGNEYNISYFPAYTERTSPNNWYNIPEGKKFILDELKKIVIYNFEDYLKFVYGNKK